MKTKRTFIAIHIEPNQQVLDCIENCKRKLHGNNIKWVDPKNFHLTLKFLGDTSVDDIPNIIESCEDIISTYKSFRIDCSELGVFPNPYNAKVLWTGITPSLTIAKIKDGIENELCSFGFEKENRKFKPHLTLARIKHIQNPAILKQLITTYKGVNFQQIKVDEIVLYESKLTPKGAIYNKIHNFDLIP